MNRLIVAAIISVICGSADAQINNPSTATGTVTSIATGCQATGGTITTTGTISTQITPTSLASANPAILTGVCGGIETLDNASNDVPTIAVAGATGFGAGWYTTLCVKVNFTKTITPASGTIGGNSVYRLGPGTAAAPSCITIISDASNTNYIVQGGVNPDSLHPGFTGASSLWTIAILPGDSFQNGSSLSITTTYCTPFLVQAQVTVDQLGTRMSTNGTSNNQYAIYQNDTSVSPARPGVLLANTGNVVNTSSPATGAINNPSSITSIGLSPGMYWTCFQIDDTTGVAAVKVTPTNNGYGAYVGSSTAANEIAQFPPEGVSVTGTFGTWSSNLHGSTWTEINTTVPVVWYRIKSAP